MRAASAGKWAAVALFVFVGVLIAIAAATEMSRSGWVEDDLGVGDVDLSDIPPAEFVEPGEMDEASILQGGEGWTWRQVGESGRVQYVMTAARVDPAKGGKIVLGEPEARIDLGGRVARIRAAEGDIVKPHDGEPESGWLGGGVVVEVFEYSGEDLEGAAFDGAEPLGRLETPSLAFDTALGQIETRDEIRLTAPGVAFTGRGLTVRVGELEKGRRYRLNLLRIDRSGGLRVRPDALSKGSESSSDEGTGEGGRGGEAEEGAAPIDYYRMTIDDDVRIERGGQRLSSERVDAFARLIGGKLAPEAIGAIEIPEAGPRKPREVRDRWSSSFARPAESAPEDPASGDIVMTWSGPLEIVPERSEPGELARDDVLVRFSSPSRNVVEVADDGSGAHARCASLMYGLTSRRLFMTGVGGSPLGVRLWSDGVGEILGDSIELELDGMPRGRVRMTSAGVARSLETDEAGELSWEKRAEIGFEVARDGAGTLRVLPRMATASGSVFGTQGGARVSADEVRAGFVEGGSLGTLSLEGSVRAQTEDGGALVADRAELEFGADGSGQPMPEAARADGSVRVARGGDWLTSERLAVTLGSDEAGRLRVDALEADTGVAMGTERGVGATTERLRADLLGEKYELQGDSTELFSERDGRRFGLASASISIDGATRRVVAFGRGEATFRLPTEDGGVDSGRVEWAGGMYYDDVAGVADVMDRVVASRVPAPLERQEGEAGQVRIRFTAWSGGEDDVEDRAVLGIELEGTEDERARLELRRYRAPDEAEGRSDLETLVALRSDVIRFDAVEEVLSVPASGDLVVEDRRPGDGAGRADSPLGEGGDVRGTTAFEWQDSLTFRRRTGEAEMGRGVRVRHLGAETARLTRLECESLFARFRRPGEEEAGRSPLLGVDASEAVYLRHETIELVCDALRFDARDETVAGEAAPGNRVTVLDSADGRHFTAAGVGIDLRTGRWWATEATGVGVSE